MVVIVVAVVVELVDRSVFASRDYVARDIRTSYFKRLVVPYNLHFADINKKLRHALTEIMEVWCH